MSFLHYAKMELIDCTSCYDLGHLKKIKISNELGGDFNFYELYSRF